MSTSARLALFGSAIVVALVGALALFSPFGTTDTLAPPSDDGAPPNEPVSADESPSVSASTPTPAVAAAVDASAPLDPERASEDELTSWAAGALRRAPAEALRLVEIADRRFGVESETRRVIEIRALVGLGRIPESHIKAETFYRHYPESPDGERIERLTGAHPRPPFGPSAR